MSKIRELLIEARGPIKERFGEDNDLFTKVEVSKGLLQAAISTISNLEAKVADLESKVSWRDNPDRMWGQYDEWVESRRYELGGE